MAIEGRRAWLRRHLTLLGGAYAAGMGLQTKMALSLENKAQTAIDFDKHKPWRSLACWDDGQGRHWAGWLHLQPAAPSASQPTARWAIVKALELPTRGHGVLILPNGDALVVARRPGDWWLHWPAPKGTHQPPPRWHWIEPGRALNGHIALSEDGRHLLSTERDTLSDEGRVGLRRISDGELIADHATHGQDPHMVLALTLPTWATGAAPQPLWWIANGGIPTTAQTGRRKRHLEQMDASLVCLSAQTGALVQQWRLNDARLSLRHLAYHAHPATGLSWAVALQAEHDDAAQRQAAPLLALLQGRDWAACQAASLRTAVQQPVLQGYGGDVAWLPPPTKAPHDAPSGGWVVSANHANALAFYDAQGHFLQQAAWPQAGALASSSAHVWAAGAPSGAWQARQQLVHTPTPLPSGLRLDNHWACIF